MNLQKQLQEIKNQTNLYKKEHKSFDEQLELLKEKNLIKKYPNVNLKSMGFIENWEELEIWKDN
jgi:abortive infection bacteriophage resistance protein